MRILQINASYKPAYIYGGPTMSVSKLAEQLVNAGCDVKVFTTTANGDNELDVTPNEVIIVDSVPVTYFSRILKGHIHFSPKLLAAVWRNCWQYDVVHIHAWWNTVSVLSCFIAMARGVKVVVSPRGTLSAYSFAHKNSFLKQAIHNLIGRPLLNRTHIHTTSTYEETKLTRVIEPVKYFVLPNFVALSDANSNAAFVQSDKLKLVFFSRIDDKKGLDVLFKALALVKRPYALTIAGGGDPIFIDTLKKQAQNLNILAHINWIGVQNENKFDMLAGHDIMILPSRDENFGNVVIESLSVGTAVIVSPNVGLSDYVIENSLGWVTPNQPVMIAELIAKLQYQDLALIRQQAPVVIRDHFDEKALTAKYLAMYQQVIKG
ncbi:XrtY-associated glycosyltransferase XYAG1 [Mucilaginibacter myungsuensis]|uniref:Glycosyltransferase n=1 Tax=Mucilaginibacter myungsuensis TaxID=649104 RepID=A0A929L039_9SPHI|nr:glycosyltransferase [Mucilaginibacter myungsuensis]MBE9660841.1 glycosyltransferase [Mucilaginibacter myungsuensis]MDN3600888.1 glycosyltransferase [Mucilaginibacter myungsuensis]